MQQIPSSAISTTTPTAPATMSGMGSSPCSCSWMSPPSARYSPDEPRRALIRSVWPGVLRTPRARQGRLAARLPAAAVPAAEAAAAGGGGGGGGGTLPRHHGAIGLNSADRGSTSLCPAAVDPRMRTAGRTDGRTQ